ncbi:hypothetical protein FOL47_008068 [Perkinsus chesapeaki]|uniref:DUF155 domain-containing protein n=1 Tax=Perkinsus chesapeaki TaxID=330153 RepID=A0A7J6N2R6_PERCH|nr:hypothetical protein FOL47_008068 [Perkinsus chesapeaki]
MATATGFIGRHHNPFTRKPLVALTTTSLPLSSRVRVRVLWDTGSLDLRKLNNEMKERGAETCISSQGGWLYANLASSSSAFHTDHHPRTAVFFRDNALVTWCTSIEEDDGLAAIAEGFRLTDPVDENDDLSYLYNDGKEGGSLPSSARCVSEEVMAVEQIDRTALTIQHRKTGNKKANAIASTRRHLPPKIDSKVVDGVLLITSQDIQRSSELLVASLALASASRLNLVEAKIERFLKVKHTEMNSLAANLRSWHLNSVSDEIFKSERTMHTLRYQLNLGEADLLDVPEILWEFDGSERLFEQVVNNFDLKRRIGLLNLRLSYHSDFMAAFGEHVRHRRKEFLRRPSKAASLKGSSPLVIAQRYPNAFNFPYSLKEYEMEGEYMKHRMKLRDISDEEKRKREALLEAEARLEDEQLAEIEGGFNTSRSGGGGGAKIRVMAKIGVMRRLSALTPQSKTIEEGLELIMQKKGRRDFYLDPIGLTKATSSSASSTLHRQLRFLHESDPTLITFIKDVYGNIRKVCTSSVFVTMPEQSFIRYQGAYIKHLIGFIPDPPLIREPRFTDGLRFLVTDISELDLDAEMDTFIIAIENALRTHINRILAEDATEDEKFNIEIDIKLGMSGLINLIRTVTPIQISMYLQESQLEELSDGEASQWDGSSAEEVGQPSGSSEMIVQDSNRHEVSNGNPSQTSLLAKQRLGDSGAKVDIKGGHAAVEDELREQLTAALEEQERLQSLVIKLTQELEQSRRQEDKAIVLSPTVEIVYQLPNNQYDNVSEVNSTGSYTSSLNDNNNNNKLIDLSHERVMARVVVDSLVSSIVISVEDNTTTAASADVIAQDIIANTIRKKVEEGDTPPPPPAAASVEAADTEEEQPQPSQQQQQETPSDEGAAVQQQSEVKETIVNEDNNESPQPPASSRSSLSAPRRGHTQEKPRSADSADIKPETAEGNSPRSSDHHHPATTTPSPPSTYRGAIVRADDDDDDGHGGDGSSNDLTTVVRKAIDMYQSILGEYASDTRTAGHTRAVLNTLHRAAAELGLSPSKGITDIDQSSSALVLASMLPIAGPPPTADDMKYNRAIADTFYFYTIKNAYIPHGNGDVTFDIIEAARHQLPFAGIWKMSKDLSLVPHLVNKEEVLECFRYACKGLSRPPHNVPIEDAMKELCRRYLIPGLDKMRRFGGDIVPPLSARKPSKGNKRRPAGRVIRQQQQQQTKPSSPVVYSPSDKRPLLVKAGRLRLLQPRKGDNGAPRLGNWPLHLLKPGRYHRRGKQGDANDEDDVVDLEALNEKERRIMDMLDRNEDARMDRALHRQTTAQERSGA